MVMPLRGLSGGELALSDRSLVQRMPLTHGLARRLVVEAKEGSGRGWATLTDGA